MSESLDRLMWVAHSMPDECALALAHFTLVNPHWRGANWEDCLDVLLDSDSHIDVTDVIWCAFDEMDPPYRVMPPVSEIAVTLLWTTKDHTVPTVEQVKVFADRWSNGHGS